MQEQSVEAKAWASERREFGVTAREEDLDARIRVADAREEAADEREAATDRWLRELGQLDEATAAHRAQARTDRAQAREDRGAAAGQRLAARQGDAESRHDRAAAGEYPLAGRFAELATQLFAAGNVVGVLEQLLRTAVAMIDGAEVASVTVHQDGRPRTLAYEGHLANDLDQLQYHHGQGPCLDASAEAGTAYAACSDLGSSDQWPRFAAAAVDSGARAVLAFGMFPQASESLPRLASLNLYATAPDAFDDSDRDVGMLLAAHGAVALAAATALDQASLQAGQLRQAAASRDVIGQAKGILMERRRCTPEQAFDILRDASNRLNTKLHTLAEQLTRTGEAPPERRKN